MCLALCCLQSTAAQFPTSSLTTAYSITSTPTTRSSISPCAPITHPPGCPFSPSVPLTSDSGTLGENGLQLNPDKSEALIVGTTNQLRAVTSSVSSVSVAKVDLPVADDIKVLGVVLDRRLSYHKHMSAVARLCNYHAQAIRHIHHLLTTELAQTLARIDYCNAVLHGAPSYSIRKLQRVQNNAARIVLEASRRSHASPLLRTLH